MPRGLICPEEPKNGRVYKDVICAFMEENAAEDRYGGQDSTEGDPVPALPVDNSVSLSKSLPRLTLHQARGLSQRICKPKFLCQISII